MITDPITTRELLEADIQPHNLRTEFAGYRPRQLAALPRVDRGRPGWLGHPANREAAFQLSPAFSELLDWLLSLPILPKRDWIGAPIETAPMPSKRWAK